MLHVCCAPCSCAILEWLKANNIRPQIYFYNPNIHPKEEYERRREEVYRYAKSQNIEMREGSYDPEQWLSDMHGLAHEPERGERCRRCIAQRLDETARMALAVGCPTFATSLSASRWKNLEQINDAGREAAKKYPDTTFWEQNWRRGGLSERRRELIALCGFYTQSFCGCLFSRGYSSFSASQAAAASLL